MGWQANPKRSKGHGPVLTPIVLSATTLPTHTLAPELSVRALPHQLPLASTSCPLATLLLMSTGFTAPSVHRLLDTEQLREIDLADRVMEEIDVESFLLYYGMQPSESVVRAVLEHTPGWTFRRQLAALSIHARTSSMEAALPQPSAQIGRPLSIQAGLASPLWHSAGAMSVSDQVPLARAHAIARSNATVLEAFPRKQAFIDLRSDERPWAARDLVRSLSVSGVLAGGGGDVVRHAVELPEFGESEPLLLAAAAVEHSWLDVAESALNRAESELAQAPNAEATDLLNVALVKMALTCQRGDAVGGLAAGSRLQQLIERLQPREHARTPELLPLIDYYLAGCEWSMGRLDTARSTLQIWAGSLERTHGDDETSAEQLVRTNCAGRLAWLDAFCGDLRRSMRYATAVLTTRRADSDERGVRFAHLATVLVHLERGEIEQAIQRLDHAVSRSADEGEPLLAAAQQLTKVRLAMETHGPRAALEQLEHGSSISRKSSLGWFAEQFRLAEAEAYLAGGEAREAIATLARSPHVAVGEASLLLAKAHRIAGDISAAEAALDQMPSISTGDALVTKLRRWLLLAQLHVERNDIQVAELLVERALRAAGIEELRGTVRQADGWLRSFVARDAHLLLRHSAFLGSLGYEAAPRTPRQREESEPLDALIVVPLTARETDVLNLLAEYCSNEEIAADLVVSMNTVKTHIRSLFQKLTVTRRADAVRRGRALGLC